MKLFQRLVDGGKIGLIKNMNYKILFIVFTILGSLLLTSFVLADFRTTAQSQLVASGGERGANLPTPADPRSVIATIIKGLLGFVGTLFFVYTIYAGFVIMTAAGDQTKVDKGKSTLTTGVIGIVLILMAYALTIVATQIILRANQAGERDPLRTGIDVEIGEAPLFGNENDPLRSDRPTPLSL